MATSDLKYWCALLRTPGVGCKTFLRLIKQATPAEIFSSNQRSLQRLGLKPASIQAIKYPNWNLVELDLKWVAQTNHHILTIDDAQYPSLLKEIVAPPMLFVNGNLDVLNHPQIAIVGSRNPSTLGKQIAIDFAASLASNGFAITSGLALGIDAASHKGALKSNGFTIAVAGTGPDRIYPARHQQLAKDIVQNGALVSEFPPGTTAKASNFPQRNRIISGLSMGLLVVEAAQKSGSLITARFALEQDREVFAIPGSIYNPLARGCNALIRQGAKLVETTQDIIEELGQFAPKPSSFKVEITAKQDQIASRPSLYKQKQTLEAEHQTLLNVIQYSPTTIDTLVQETGKSVEIIASMLLALELQGFVVKEAGGHYIRRK